MLRVLHVTEAPGWGVFSLLKEFTFEQHRRGYDVHILAPPQMRCLSGVRRHDWSLERGRPSSYPRGLYELRRTIREVAPDVVHLHSFMAGFFGRLPLLPGTAGIPVVYQPHAWSFDVFGNPKLASVMRFWERLGSRRTSGLVTNCADEIDEGRRAGVRTRAVPIGVAVDTDHFAPVDAATRQRHRSELGLDGQGVLLCLGRLARQKGQDQLVAAWEGAPIPDSQLVLVGLDDDAALRRLAPTQWGNTITAVGPQPDVRPWIWACDALVLPSRYETVSLVIPEAMSCARPAVATRVSGVAEILIEGPHPAAGSVVPLGDMPALLSECRRLLSDRDLRNGLGRAARTRAVEQFRTEAVVDRLEGAYQEAMQSPAMRT